MAASIRPGIISTGSGETRAGGRYSRFVGLMRIGLPVVACAIIVLVIAWPQIDDGPQKFKLGLSTTMATEGGEQQIVNPRFTGIDRKQQPYTVTADAASPKKNKPENVALSFPKADITTNGGAWLALSADTGLYNRNTERLDLSGSVNLFHDAGHEIKTSTAQIDLAKGTAVGEEPVVGHGPVGTLSSTGFQVMDSGARLLFTGKSKLILYPAKKKKGSG